MIRHQSILLAATAGVVSALLIPGEPNRMLAFSVPALWLMAWTGYCRDLILAAVKRLTAELNGTEKRIGDQIDIATADTLIAIRNSPPNQREAVYDRPTTLRRI